MWGGGSLVSKLETISSNINDISDGISNKLDKSNVTSKGSATRPVYFNANGEAVQTTYELNKTVPSNAVFTDTWRGIQNNLTSTSTTDSLSAAQGKILNDSINSFKTFGSRLIYNNHHSGQTATITLKSLGGLSGELDVFLIIARSWAATADAQSVFLCSYVTNNYLNCSNLVSNPSAAAPTIYNTGTQSLNIQFNDVNGGSYAAYRIN